MRHHDTGADVLGSRLETFALPAGFAGPRHRNSIAFEAGTGTGKSYAIPRILVVMMDTRRPASVDARFRRPQRVAIFMFPTIMLASQNYGRDFRATQNYIYAYIRLLKNFTIDVLVANLFPYARWYFNTKTDPSRTVAQTFPGVKIVAGTLGTPGFFVTSQFTETGVTATDAIGKEQLA
jgi:hypothetical protein